MSNINFLGLSKIEKKKLEYELIPYEVRLRLTRLIRISCEIGSNEIKNL